MQALDALPFAQNGQSQASEETNHLTDGYELWFRGGGPVGCCKTWGRLEQICDKKDKGLQEGTVGSLQVRLSHKLEVHNLVGTMEIHCIPPQVDYKTVQDSGTPDTEQGRHQPNFDFAGQWWRLEGDCDASGVGVVNTRAGPIQLR